MFVNPVEHGAERRYVLLTCTETLAALARQSDG
jgi:hypothetical protein